MPDTDKGKTDDKGTTDPVDDQDPTGTNDDTDDDAADSEWKPPSRADWDALQESLKKARRDARAARKAANGNGTAPGDKDGDTAPDVEKVKADALAEADGKWKPLVVRAAARSAFIEAGLVLPKKNPDGAMARVLKLLDVEDLTIEDDGTLDGLTEQVEDIKADFPELFTAAGRNGRAGRVDGADRSGQANGKPKTASEIQAAALLGNLR
ncbi:MAG: hypothetical protein M3460_04590 [Actinomycetota bacterium]|nr:hypothetical protein [Actinomycetota bacterium]